MDGTEYAARLDVRSLSLSKRSVDIEPWYVASVRPATREDYVLVISAHPAAPDPRAPLARISAPHHMLAKLVAEGKENAEISAITGYSPNRISVLKKDPAFSELVTHYEQYIIEAEANIHAQIQHIALTAMQHLQERLDEEPEKFSIKDLQSLANNGLDRIGYGPSSKLNVNVNDPAKVLQTLQEAMQTEREGRILSRKEIEATYVEVPKNGEEADKS